MTNRKIIQTTGSILINKNIEKVFDFFSNPSNDKLWRAEINESTLDGALQLKVMVSEYSNLSKKAANNLIRLECVRFDKNKIAIFETPANSQFYLKSQRQTKPVSDKTTEIFYAIDFDSSIVKLALGFPLPRFIISLKAKSDMKKYLRQLKRHLEKE